MPTGDAVLIDVAEKGYFIPPHPSPREIKKDSLVLLELHDFPGVPPSWVLTI